MRHQSPHVHAVGRHEVDGARKVVAHAAHELDLQAAPARIRSRKRVGVAVRNARKNHPACNPRGAHRVSEPQGAIGRLDYERAAALARCVDEVLRYCRDILCAQFERGRAGVAEQAGNGRLTIEIRLPLSTEAVSKLREIFRSAARSEDFHNFSVSGRSKGSKKRTK